MIGKLHGRWYGILVMVAVLAGLLVLMLAGTADATKTKVVQPLAKARSPVIIHRRSNSTPRKPTHSKDPTPPQGPSYLGWTPRLLG